ncbi:MAG: hypothetical protein J6C20_05020 [Paludibacteraceae bacterium]|nr:hypothetical protein [Paludibacteraceae bacterium]
MWTFNVGANRIRLVFQINPCCGGRMQFGRIRFGRMQFAPTVDCAMAFSLTTSPMMYILSTMRQGMKYKPDANRLKRWDVDI